MPERDPWDVVRDAMGRMERGFDDARNRMNPSDACKRCRTRRAATGAGTGLCFTCTLMAPIFSEGGGDELLHRP